MTTITYAEARTNLAKIMKKVCEDHAPIVITRSNAESVVIIALSDYEAIQDTNHLMSNPANASRLGESIDEIEKMIQADK